MHPSDNPSSFPSRLRLCGWRLSFKAIVGALMVASGTVGTAGAADVGVSIVVSQPGVYGRIDIGQFPRPQVIVTQPIMIHKPPSPRAVPVSPVYLWVPPGHRRNWSRHCGRYGACGVPVYFVRDDWYQRTIQPHAKSRPEGRDRPREHRGGPPHEHQHAHGRHEGRRGHGNGH